jgi:hypothetical protein
VLDATLVDLDASVAATISVGQVQRVGLWQERFPVVYVGDARLGSITSGRVSVLVRCLKAGEPFVAEVCRADGGWVDVHVRHA